MERVIGIKDTVEYLYLCLMDKWAETAPSDGCKGELDGKPKMNTQVTRLVYIISNIANGQANVVYSKLSLGSRRKDGNSYISKNYAWMKQPEPLSDGWYFEGCTSLVQKQEIIHALSRTGCSGALIAAINDFVAGKSVKPHLALDEATTERLRKIIEADEDFKTN